MDRRGGDLFREKRGFEFFFFFFCRADLIKLGIVLGIRCVPRTRVYAHGAWESKRFMISAFGCICICASSSWVTLPDGSHPVKPRLVAHVIIERGSTW